MTPGEKQFLDELNIYRNEVNSALKFLYTELAIHGIASKNKKILSALNSSPTFWNTILNALQHSTFITLGRIFDPDPEKHTIHKLLKIVENNKNLFTKESFKERWLKNDDKVKINDWLPQYLKTVYVPTVGDFREFKKFIAIQKKTYVELFGPIRHQFGHKIYDNNEDVEALFDKIQVKDLEKFCIRLEGIHEALWQLYHNGRGPMLPIRHGRYSTKNILKKKYKQYHSMPANAQFIGEVTIVLNLLKEGKAVVARKVKA